MRKLLPTFDLTKDALVIRIPWETLRERQARRARHPRLTASDILKLVEDGRRAHRGGKARLIGSLRELMS